MTMGSTDRTEMNERRTVSRISLPSPVRVEGDHGIETEWSEMTKLKDASALGAAFRLGRFVERGRLVLMRMVLPNKMRAYDLYEPQYRIWGLVRRCLQIDEGAESPAYTVGVAFIGKRPPNSYFEDPTSLYDVSPNIENGLWHVTEARSKLDENRPVEQVRRHSRYPIPLNIQVDLVDKDGNIIRAETTATENISLGGAAIFSSFDVAPGSQLRITSEQYEVTIKAIVRGRRIGADGIRRLHVEFLDNLFPLTGIDPGDEQKLPE